MAAAGTMAVVGVVVAVEELAKGYTLVQARDGDGDGYGAAGQGGSGAEARAVCTAGQVAALGNCSRN